MNFPLRTAFTVSHRFWVVVFSFSFVSMHILISFLIMGYELGTVPAHPWGAGLNPHLGRREETGIAPEKNWSRVSSWS